MHVCWFSELFPTLLGLFQSLCFCRGLPSCDPYELLYTRARDLGELFVSERVNHTISVASACEQICH